MRLLRQLVFILLIYVAYRLIKSMFYPSLKKGYKEGMGKPRSSMPDEMVKDPNCQIYLPKKEALPEEIGGVWHYFCSEECVRKYREKIGKQG